MYRQTIYKYLNVKTNNNEIYRVNITVNIKNLKECRSTKELVF